MSNTHIGMAKPVADVEGENYAGFASDTTKVFGFSSLHDSGNGGVSSWQQDHTRSISNATRSKGGVTNMRADVINGQFPAFRVSKLR